MAILFCDSFDHYAFADRLLKWTADASQGSGPGPTAGAGRNGTKGYRLNDWGYGIRKNIATNVASGGCAFGFYTSSIPVATPSLIRFLDGVSTQIDLRLGPTGKLIATRAGQVLGSSSALLTPAVYHHLEIAVTISNAAGTVDVWLDSILVLSLTGIDTQATANAYFDGINLCAQGGEQNGNGGGPDFDDLILWDTSGAINTGPAGDCRVEALFPTGAGTTTGMTPSAGANWQCVDDATPNGDTDYVSTAVPGTFDTYAAGNLATAAGAVRAVQTFVYARKDDAGAHTANDVIRSGAADYDGAALPLTTSYAMLPTVHETDPATAAAWTIAAVNAAEFGAKLAT